MRDLGQAHFRVAHGRGVVAVDRAEVALAVDQHVAQREGLGHAHDGVVNRAVAVGVVLTHDVTHDTGTLAERAVPVVVLLVHRVQRAAVHRLEAIARVGQSAPHDHAHGVVEVASPHFLFKTDRQGLFGELCHERGE